MGVFSALRPGTSRRRAVDLLCKVFSEAGIDSARIDARLLVCDAAGIDHASLIGDPGKAVGAQAAALIKAHASRRLRSEPVARILGRRQFWSLDLLVTPDVLDPRPDSETVVSAVLAALGARCSAPLSILDLGTGSGALLCALLTECPAASGVAVDLSPAAAMVARENLARHRLLDRALVLAGVWGDALAGSFDVIVSNPPYIRRADIAALAGDVRDYDPALALDGGPDGLDAYRAICDRIPQLVALDGVVCLECGLGQGGDIAPLLRSAGLERVEPASDLAGRGRVLIGRRSL